METMIKRLRLAFQLLVVVATLVERSFDDSVVSFSLSFQVSSFCLHTDSALSTRYKYTFALSPGPVSRPLHRARGAKLMSLWLC